MATEIDALISSINKRQKAEVLIRGADLVNTTWSRTPSGSLSLDVMLGGGWPLNAMNEIIGLESSGKTTIALKTLAENQHLNSEFHTVWVAAEEFDPGWAAKLGVDVSRITFVMSNIMEIAFDSALAVMTERATDCVVIDSLPALAPGEEAEKSMAEFTVGKGALLTNKFMRKCYTAASRSLVEYDRPVLVLIINQWRDRVGVMYGDPRTTPGGKGKNYAYVTRTEVSRLEYLSDHGNKVGQTIKCQTLKNKTSTPRREAQVDFYFSDYGDLHVGEYDLSKEIFGLALVNDVIAQKGAWYHYQNQKWQGEKATWAAIKTDPLLYDALDTEVRTVLGLTSPAAAAGAAVKPNSRRRRVEEE